MSSDTRDLREQHRTGATSCHVCHTPLRFQRHSSRWGFDVGRCPQCGTVSVVDAPGVIRARQDPEADTPDMNWDAYDIVMRKNEDIRFEVLQRLRALLPDDLAEPDLFDVGAGSGAFLVLAREHGFRVAGNDLSPASVDYVARTYGIDLSPQPLADQPPASADAMTMWCVLAHVGDPQEFLREAFAMLRPGGILFLRTPRWCSMDAVGRGLERGSFGRFAKVPDKRITPGHLHLYSDEGLEKLLSGVGFEDVDLTGLCHFGSTTEMLAKFIGGPPAVERTTARVLDRFLDSRVAPRNTLLAYARKPL